MKKKVNKETTNVKDVKILLIEDNKVDIQTITNFIEQSKRLNAQIKTVDSIKKAKTIMFYEPIDIILIDINVQGMKFDEFYDAFDQDNLSIPYIVITDERDEDIGIEAVKKVAQD